MYQAINLVDGGFDISCQIGLTFFNFLSNSYIKENEVFVQHIRSKEFTLYKWNSITKRNESVDKISITFCSAEALLWLKFKKWCLEKEVIVSARKTMIDRQGLWWPAIVYWEAKDDNEHLFYSKLIAE